MMYKTEKGVNVLASIQWLGYNNYVNGERLYHHFYSMSLSTFLFQFLPDNLVDNTVVLAVRKLSAKFWITGEYKIGLDVLDYPPLTQ